MFVQLDGLYVEGLPFSPAKLKLINWHKWAGVTILLLSVLRLVWRLAHRPPARGRGLRDRRLARLLCRRRGCYG